MQQERILEVSWLQISGTLARYSRQCDSDYVYGEAQIWGLQVRSGVKKLKSYIMGERLMGVVKVLYMYVSMLISLFQVISMT